MFKATTILVLVLALLIVHMNATFGQDATSQPTTQPTTQAASTQPTKPASIVYFLDPSTTGVINHQQVISMARDAAYGLDDTQKFNIVFAQHGKLQRLHTMLVRPNKVIREKVLALLPDKLFISGENTVAVDEAIRLRPERIAYYGGLRGMVESRGAAWQKRFVEKAKAANVKVDTWGSLTISHTNAADALRTISEETGGTFTPAPKEKGMFEK